MDRNGRLFNPSYVGPRPDILRLIPMLRNQKILDVGCSVGTLGASLKQRDNAFVVGIEADKAMAEQAETMLDRVICGDVETLMYDALFETAYFNCIIFADVLEHLKDPWTTLRRLVPFLRDDGTVVASIPNVGHHSVVLNLLLRQRWSYGDRGILDRSHVRFFTLHSIRQLFDAAALQVQTVERNYRLIERPHWINAYAKDCALYMLRDLLTFQYIVVARKRVF